MSVSAAPEGELAQRIALERADATQRALAGVLAEIDRLSGNDVYRRAWKKVAIRVQDMMRDTNC